jgi:hypothetical protein
MLTREDILAQYDVDESGRIRDPGKFEGEMLYVPYFYGFYLNGLFDDEDDTGKLVFYVTEEDRKEFPELKNRKIIRLYETQQGFVCED